MIVRLGLAIYITTFSDTTLSVTEMDCEASYFFNAVKEGDSVTFATTDENERHNWVQALYRATGQSHKPTPPVVTSLSNGTKGLNQPNLPKMQGGKYIGTKLSATIGIA